MNGSSGRLVGYTWTPAVIGIRFENLPKAFAGVISFLLSSNMEFTPSPILRPFVKSYSIIKLDRELVNEVFYPSGYVDFAVKISDGSAATVIGGHARNMPETEVLGQLTMPTRLSLRKGTSVLLARLYPHSSALFLNCPVSEFTNYAVDLRQVFANEAREFHDQLIHTNSDGPKVRALDSFLIQKLRKNEKIYKKTSIIGLLCNSICRLGDSFDIKVVAREYGLSERYIQKLYLEIVGLTPRSFFNIQRFNKSVQLVLSTNDSLTSIAYECGYYDQAHFIKEFRKFTGITPSEARPSLSEGGLKFQQAVNIGL